MQRRKKKDKGINHPIAKKKRERSIEKEAGSGQILFSPAPTSKHII